MKITLFLFATLCSLSITKAQTIDFVLADPQPNLIEVYGGSFASGDIDSDGDQDLLMAGLDPGRETALYLNDGEGNFTEVTNIPFPEASDTVTLFEDLDGDGDLDLYFSGRGFNIGDFAHIYLNDGLGVFTLLTNSALPEFRGKGAALGDLDGDGDLDLFISAEDTNGDFTADVYLNDGAANFTAMGSTAFEPYKFAAVAFLDVENDNDLDLIISGERQDDARRTSLYLNDGSGNYSVDTNADFVDMSADDVDIADTDNDGDLDILMSGRNDASEVRTILYTNNGAGEFTEQATGMQDTFAGTNAIADLDNDGDQDILIVGSQDGGLPNIFNKVYQNMGNNVFEEVAVIGGEYIAACIVDDFNGDDLLDIIIQGFVENTNVYWNDSTVLSVSDSMNATPVAIYPNPSNGLVIIDTPTVIPTNITVYNSLGTLVYRQSAIVTKSNNVILTQPPGIYVVVIETQSSTLIRKLILN